MTDKELITITIDRYTDLHIELPICFTLFCLGRLLLMDNKYFKNISTLEDLRKQYKELLKLPPDNGGNLKIMQAVNAGYDNVKLFPPMIIFSLW